MRLNAAHDWGFKLSKEYEEIQFNVNDNNDKNNQITYIQMLCDCRHVWPEIHE